MKVSLLEWLRQGKKELALIMDENYAVDLGDDHTLTAIARIRHFGGMNGMLIFGAYGVISDHASRIRSLGYGFSVMEERGSNYEFDQYDFVSVLRDWGWTSKEYSEPTWLNQNRNRE